jgi:mycothiol synthase
MSPDRLCPDCGNALPPDARGLYHRMTKRPYGPDRRRADSPCAVRVQSISLVVGSSMRIFGARVMPCPVEARPAALEVLYRRMPRSLRGHLIAEVLEDARRGELDLSGLWVARIRSGRIVGAMMTQALAGKAAALWPPEVGPSWRRAALAAALVQAALDDLAGRGYCLVQAALDESAGLQAARDLTRGGMPRVTELLYLERDTTTPLPFCVTAAPPTRESRGPEDRAMTPNTGSPMAPGPDFDWRAFDSSIAAEFHEVLQATYVGSLDMPELEGARGLEDILAGHQATGLFVPELWRLGRIPGEPGAAAVLLLTEVPNRDACEVVYLGLTPPARGRGLGRAVIRHALELARDLAPTLELAVDLRNTPAVQLYRSTGFTPRDRRAVHLAILG